MVDGRCDLVMKAGRLKKGIRDAPKHLIQCITYSFLKMFYLPHTFLNKFIIASFSEDFINFNEELSIFNRVPFSQD